MKNNSKMLFIKSVFTECPIFLADWVIYLITADQARTRGHLVF